MSQLENNFEKALWNTRFIILIAVILSVLASITLFILGGWDIIQATIFNNPLFHQEINNNNELLRAQYFNWEILFKPLSFFTR